MEKLISCIMGPSGSGKSTITDLLVKNHDILLPLHTTTREPRIDDRLNFYSYITLDKFVELMNKNLFLIASTDGYRGYGVLKEECEKCFQICDTLLLHASYKDIEQLKECRYKIKLIVLTYKNIEKSIIQRLSRSGRNHTSEDLKYRISSAIKDHEIYFDSVRNFADKIIYTDEKNIEETYKIVTKTLGFSDDFKRRIM